jgi:ribosomal protein S18 acetylase RimI-like enzyme
LQATCNADERIDLPFFFPEAPIETGEREHVLVWSGDRLIGFGQMPAGDEPEGCLMVHPAHRRLGIGSAILDAFRDELRRRDRGEGWVVADLASPSARAFLDAAGLVRDMSEFRLEWRKSKSPTPPPPNAKLSLRRAVDDDAEALIDLMRRALDRDLEDARARVEAGLRETKRHFYVAFIEDAPIGMIRAGEIDGAGDITAFGVLPEKRGRGIGRRILTETVRMLADEGLDRVLIEVAVENASALGLYRSCGFEIVSEYGFHHLAAKPSREQNGR